MTGELDAAADPKGLWARLSTFDIGSRPSLFERRLADENGWTDAHACRVIGEYRRFLYLASVADFEVTPSQVVDAAWHLHLEDEAHYREALCGALLGRMLEHRPGTGDPLEEARFREQYRRTLALYESVFGPPPADIWPRAEAFFYDGEGAADAHARWLLWIALAAAATTMAAILHPPAVWIGLGLLLALLLGFAITRTPRPRKGGHGGGACGAGCSGSSSDSGCSDSGADGCASCGGGGCGGGD